MLKVVIIGLTDIRTGDEDGIPTGFYRTGAKCVSQSALDLVPCYCVANAFANHEAKAACVEAVGQITDYQETVRSAAAVAVNLRNA